MFHLGYLGAPVGKAYRLVIKCDKETYSKFRGFSAANFKTHEDALEYLLNLAESQRAPFSRY